MRNQWTVLFTVLAISIVACKNAGKQTSDNDVEKVYSYNIDNTKEYIDLNLTDLAENFKLIPLETTEKSLLGRSTFYVCDQYILAYTDNGVYKFAPDGKFIKKMINAGKGPQEISQFYSPNKYFVADNNLLYINDYQHNDNILVYDIINEQFKEPIKKCIPGYWSSVAVDNKGVIMGTPRNPLKADSLNYAVIFQNATGELISGILNRKLQTAFPGTEELGYQSGTIMLSEKNFKIHFSSDDTLYSIMENRLTPYLILEFDKPREYPTASIPQTGDRMLQFPDAEAPGFMILNAMVAKDSRTIKNGDNTVIVIENSQNYVFLNKFSGTASLIRTFKDNLIGNTQDILQIVEDKIAVNFPQILPNNQLVVAYNSFDIIDAVDKGITNSTFPKDIVDQLIEISKNLKEEDNQVLLVGGLRMKE